MVLQRKIYEKARDAASLVAQERNSSVKRRQKRTSDRLNDLVAWAFPKIAYTDKEFQHYQSSSIYINGEW